LIKYVAFDLDDTLFNGTLLVEKARKASIQMMVKYGLPVDENYALQLLNEIVHEFGSNSESHLDNLMMRLQHDPKIKLIPKYNPNKFVAAGIMGYHREKVKHFKPFRDVIKTLEKLRSQGIHTAIITDGTPKKQYEKILRLKIEEYFDEILISDEVGIRKPNSNLFSLFLDKVSCKPNEVIYVGDRLDKDIEPSMKVGIISVLIHRGTKHDSYITKTKSKIKPDYNVNNLYEIFSIIEEKNALENGN
jgi:putative hydrolase of the HAD superfamily